MLSRRRVSAGLVAIAATAGALFAGAPASTQSAPAAHVGAAVARVSASTPLGAGWWRPHRHLEHHGGVHHRHCVAPCGHRVHPGRPTQPRFARSSGQGGFGGQLERSVRVLGH